MPYVQPSAQQTARGALFGLAMQVANYKRAIEAGMNHDLQECKAIALQAAALVEAVEFLQKGDSPSKPPLL